MKINNFEILREKLEKKNVWSTVSLFKPKLSDWIKDIIVWCLTKDLYLLHSTSVLCCFFQFF